MYRPGKQSAAAQRAAARREREDSAPRLAREIPELASLRLAVEERSDTSITHQPKYIRRIMVESAPALIWIPCGDPVCVDGGHDVTDTVMRALRSRRSDFEGEDACHGSIGMGLCSRVIRFEGAAEYKTP